MQLALEPALRRTGRLVPVPSYRINNRKPDATPRSHLATPRSHLIYGEPEIEGRPSLCVPVPAAVVHQEHWHETAPGSGSEGSQAREAAVSYSDATASFQ